MQSSQLFVGKQANDFTAKAVMPDGSIEFEFNLKHYTKGYKCVLFFYPLDFTFVCPSEIIAFHNRIGVFDERNTKIVSVSVDSHFSHAAWKNLPHNKGGIGNVQFPMVSDLSKEISKSYNILNDEGVAMRGTFIIDEHFVLRQIVVNDLPLGRSIEETLRMIDAIDFYNQYGEVCPAGWSHGKEAITTTHQGIADYLASNADKL